MGGSASVHAGIPPLPGPGTHRDQAHPRYQASPLGPGTPPDQAPPSPETATVVDDMHPTGMHSCLFVGLNYYKVMEKLLKQISTLKSRYLTVNLSRSQNSDLSLTMVICEKHFQNSILYFLGIAKAFI